MLLVFTTHIYNLKGYINNNREREKELAEKNDTRYKHLDDGPPD
jgi:hypothetical protein